MPDSFCRHVCPRCGGCTQCCVGPPRCADPEPEPDGDTAAGPGPSDPGSSTAGQRLEIVTLMSELNVQGRGGRLQICSDVAQRRIESALELSFTEAGAIIAQLTMSKERMVPDESEPASPR